MKAAGWRRQIAQWAVGDWANAIRAQALLDAAQEAYERGDIGKPGGVEAWVWLRARAKYPLR